MAVIWIDTAEDFQQAVGAIAPVYITSKKHGRVLVPCCNTLLVSTALVRANNYNPNYVPKEKMELLQQSILDNGFCFPVVAVWDQDDGVFIIVDGFHRSTIAGEDWLEFDYLPLVVLPHDINQRMVATIQFNKAKGTHEVDRDADVIRALLQQGMSEEEVSIHLGIDLDTIHRYKQLTGIAELFKNADYSMSWEMKEAS
jgi:ParB-like chromosome segregation protein Spo0J